MEKKKYNILLLEDNPVDRRLIENMLSRMDNILSCTSTDCLLDGKRILRNENIDVLLLDLHLADSSTEQTLVWMKDQNLPVVVITGSIESCVITDIYKNNAQGYLLKGEFNEYLLERYIVNAYERVYNQEALCRSKEVLEETVRHKTQALNESKNKIERDLQDLMLAQDNLRLSEQCYRSLIDNISVGLALISPEMTMLTSNQQMQRWFPRAGDVSSGLCYNLFHGLSQGQRCEFCPVALTFEDGQMHEVISKIETDQGVRDYRIVSSPIKNQSNRTVMAVEMMEDVTDRMKSQKALALEKERYQSLVDNLPGAVYRLKKDQGWKLEFISSEIENITGYPVSDMLEVRQCVLEAMIHEEDKARILKEAHDMERCRSSYSMEYRIKNRKGMVIWVYDRSRGLYDDFGNVIAVEGVLFDVTENKGVEK
ncbi:MAG: PAS domain S-box protein [Candidatus Omnitrophica bacterium]|nr:PAS domain S-box protein [Candidatus Omnitrophota bacterium]